MSKGDIETMMSFYAEDATLVSPFGRSQGKDAVRHSRKWVLETWQNVTTTERVRRDGLWKHCCRAYCRRKRWRNEGFIPIACLYEFSGDKIQFTNCLSTGWLSPSRQLKDVLEKNCRLHRGLDEKGLH